MIIKKYIFSRLWLLILGTMLFSCKKDKADVTLELIQTSQNTSSALLNTNQSKDVFFGDLHVHTGWSFDAYMAGVRVTPDHAYRFGKGLPMGHITGKPVQLKRPLDFMAVADHAEYMGSLMMMSEKDSPLYHLDLAKNIRSDNLSKVKKVTKRLRFSIATNWPFKELILQENLQYTWKKMVEIADKHYEPGKFTTFPAYEWTSSVAVLKSLISGPQYAQNLHRNVIYKGGKVSALPYSSFNSQNPEELWEWMDKQRQQGVELLAIPHNANISDGRMYAMETYEGDEIDDEYIESRRRNEPVNEVVQIKGQSFSHPIFSPNDEFADFELYEYALGHGSNRKKVKPQGSYVREAWQNGLIIAAKQGTNPFQFGIIGSSDGHNGGSNIEEDNNIGRSGKKDINAEMRLSDDAGGKITRKTSVAGLAAVWATQNTREGIYDALEKKEVYATTGSRMRVKFFASDNWGDLTLENDKWDSIAYTRGFPMGSEINKKLELPRFIISAVKDVEGANLERVQVIKGWIDSDGQSHEKIYNVAWSDNRKMDSNGKIPKVGSTVNLQSGTYTNDIGEIKLETMWSDPDFNPESPSYYFIRVLEIPTPRWTTFDAISIGAKLPDDAPATIQERAWTSPIWYNPK